MIKRMINISAGKPGRFHRPEPAVYTVRQEAGEVVVSCQYFTVRHARAAGYNLASIVFPHGSGRSILAAPCVTSLQRGAPFANAPFVNAHDGDLRLAMGTTDGGVRIETSNTLVNRHGETLPARCHHRFEYTPWGLLRQQVVIDLQQDIPDGWNINVARLVVAPHLDEFALRPGREGARTWQHDCRLGPWVHLGGGATFRDALAAEAGEVPLYLRFVSRGVEGFDWCCGEDLEQWHERISPLPHVGKFRVCHNPTLGGHEVSLCPLDSWPHGLPLSGRYVFDFHMGLPFVHEHVRPMVHGGDGIPTGSGPARRLPTHEEIVGLAERGVSLLRLHDDSPQEGGVFWRDGTYPPYPPERMRAMDACLADLAAHGIACTPYFSLHEISPETAGADATIAACKRTVDAAGTPLVNHGPTGIWGVQLCLLSDWRETLKRNIDTVLAKHDFAGIYFDWTLAMPCTHRGHRPHAHWDIEGFIDVLQWTRNRIGPDGILYLHMSCEPFIMAENLATCVLMNEHAAPAPCAEQLPPNGESLRNTSLLALWLGAPGDDARRAALHCLLGNAGQVPHPIRQLPVDLTRYRHFRGQTASPARTATGLGSAVWWNGDEALVVLANFGAAAQAPEFTLDAAALGWSGYRVEATPGPIAPLDFACITLRRAS